MSSTIRNILGSEEDNFGGGGGAEEVDVETASAANHRRAHCRWDELHKRIICMVGR